MKCHHRSKVSGGQRAATLQNNNFVKKIYYAPIATKPRNSNCLQPLEFVGIQLYICRRVKCIPFNCSLNPISSNHNMSRIQYRQEPLTCTFRLVRRYINRWDGYVPIRIKPRGEFFVDLNTDKVHETKYTSIVYTHCMVKVQGLQSCLRPRV